MKKVEILILLGVLFLLCIVIYALNGNFVKPANLINILRQASLLFILGIGMTLVILTGGIDLSNGSVLVLSSCIGAMVLKTHLPMVFGIGTTLCVGLACGRTNGLMVSHLRIPPFIATFAMMFMARGIAYIILRGRVVYNFSPEFRYIGTGALYGVPMPVIFAVLLFLGFFIMLELTATGVNIYAMGSNYESARLVGIDVRKATGLVYMLSGSLSACAGLLYTARLNTASPMVGTTFPLDAIAIVIIGGASLKGGEGNLIGTVIGALIITVIKNGMNLMAISSLWQQFVTGGIILAMVVIQKYSKRVRIESLLSIGGARPGILNA